MSGITSSMTDAELDAAYVDAASYLEDRSTVKAARFITVCKAMLLRATSSAKGTFAGTWNRQQLAIEAEAARRWLEARDPDYRPGPTVRNPDMTSFR